MTKKELVTIIRTVVRKEIETALESKPLKRVVREQILLKTPKIVQEIIDEELNDSLMRLNNANKTRSLTEGVSGEPMRTVAFDTDDLSTIAHHSMRSALEGGEMNVMRETPTADGNGRRPIDPDSVPDYIKNVMNRDYRGFLKKIDEKAANVSAPSYL